MTIVDDGGYDEESESVQDERGKRVLPRKRRYQ